MLYYISTSVSSYRLPIRALPTYIRLRIGYLKHHNQGLPRPTTHGMYRRRTRHVSLKLLEALSLCESYSIDIFWGMWYKRQDKKSHPNLSRDSWTYLEFNYKEM